MYFNSLQALRGIFALMIFFHHFHYVDGDGGMFDAGGDCGVAFFFILSGFVLPQGYARRSLPGGVKEPLHLFIVRRLSKIYPLHILCLIVAILLRKESVLPIISNVFLLQSWIPIDTWYFSGNSVGWCLSDFLLFYALFPLLYKCITADSRKFMRIYVIATAVYVFVVIPLIPNGYTHQIIYINPLTRLFDFVLGMVLWQVSATNSTLSFGRNAPLHLLWIALLLLVTIAVYYLIPTRYNLSVLWWPALGLLIMFAVMGSDKLLSIGPLVRFGDISFSFYLIHILCIRLQDIVYDKLGVVFAPLVRLAVYLAVTIGVAVLLHNYFVLPLERIIRKRLQATTPGSALGPKS